MILSLLTVSSPPFSVSMQPVATGSLPVCVNKPVSHSMCSSNRAHLLGRISISNEAIVAGLSLCLCTCVRARVYFHIGSDGNLFDVSLLIFLEMLTDVRDDKAGCVCVWGVGVIFTFAQLDVHTCDD